MPAASSSTLCKFFAQNRCLPGPWLFGQKSIHSAPLVPMPPYRTGIRFPRKGDLCPFQHGPALELPSFTGTELPAAFQAGSLMLHGAPWCTMIQRFIFVRSVVLQAILLQAPQQPGGPPPAAFLPMLPSRAPEEWWCLMDVRGCIADECRIMTNCTDNDLTDDTWMVG